MIPQLVLLLVQDINVSDRDIADCLGFGAVAMCTHHYSVSYVREQNAILDGDVSGITIPVPAMRIEGNGVVRIAQKAIFDYDFR